MKPKFKDETGNRYRLLRVIEFSHVQNKTAYWKCVCDCGNQCVLPGSALRAGKRGSCGCLVLSKPKRVFELKLKPIPDPMVRVKNAWANMLARCSNRNLKSYKNYGGRGISVCERWAIFENFLADMGVPDDGMTLDRINNDGNYEPGNCRWATRKQQMNNVRYNRLLTCNGKTLTMSAWAEMCGVSPATMHWRVSKWGVEKAVTKFNKFMEKNHGN